MAGVGLFPYVSYTEYQGLACILVCLTLSVNGRRVLLCLLH